MIHLLLRNPNLASPLQSISCRLLLSVLFALPQLLPASLSPDLSLHEKVLKKVQSITADLSSGTTSVMSKSLGLVIGASIADGNSEVRAEFLVNWLFLDQWDDGRHSVMILTFCYTPVYRLWYVQCPT